MATEFTQLKQTNGTFEVRGVLFGIKSENAFKEITTRNGKKMKMANLGLRISDTEVMYLSLNGMEQDYVYFSKSEKDKPTQTEKVEWAKRKRFSKEGFRLIGVGLALKKDEETQKNEPVQNLIQFDAIEYLEENAEDGLSVFVKGKIEFSSFEDAKNNNELKRSVKFVPNAIFLTKEPIDFQDSKFEKSAGFAQTVIVNNLRKEDTKFYIDFGVVGYKNYEENSIEASESLAKALKEKLKMGSSIALTGVIKTTQEVEAVTAEVWGEASTVGKAKNSGRTVLFATGARPETIDTETYAKKLLTAYIDEVTAIKKEKSNKSEAFETQGDSKEWGDKSTVTTSEESAW